MAFLGLGGEHLIVIYVHQTTIFGGIRFWIYIFTHPNIIYLLNMHIF